MSTKYKHGDRVSSNVLIDRLDELAEVVTKGPDAVRREFTMRVPAELDRDADLVLSQAARRIRELETELACRVPVCFADTGEEIEQRMAEHAKFACHFCGGSGHRDDCPQSVVAMPVEPPHHIVTAMATSTAIDDEGRFPMLMDILDFSGENKTHAVIKAAYRAAVVAHQLTQTTEEVKT